MEGIHFNPSLSCLPISLNNPALSIGKVERGPLCERAMPLSLFNGPSSARGFATSNVKGKTKLKNVPVGIMVSSESPNLGLVKG